MTYIFIRELKNTGDIEHIVEYDKMDSYLRSTLEPSVYFTLKAGTAVEHDRTYTAPTRMDNYLRR